jgi:hypothetical protein
VYVCWRMKDGGEKSHKFSHVNAAQNETITFVPGLSEKKSRKIGF